VLLLLAMPGAGRAQVRPSDGPPPIAAPEPAGAWEGAGPADVLVSSWTTEDGLPQNSINDLTTTPDGYLWLATFGGVARFDGLGFEVFDIARIPELGSNRWVSVAPADEGIFLGSESGEVVWFDGRDRVRRLSAEPQRPSSRGGLVPDGTGGLWHVSSRLLRHWDGTRWRSWGPDEGLVGELPALLVDRRGRPWIAQSNGASRLEGGRLRLVVPADQVGGRIWGLHQDAEGRIWLAGQTGLWLLGPDEVPRRVDLGPACEPPVSNVSSRGGTLWLVTRSGACRLRLDPDDPLRPQVTYAPARTMNARNWEAIHVDISGSAWVGSSGSGLRRFASGRARRWTTEKGLPPVRAVNHVTGDGAGGLWMGMGCAGLVHAGAAGVRILSAEESGIEGDCVRALLHEPDGDLWVGTYGGLSRIGRDGAVRTWIPERASGVPAVSALARDSVGRIWLAVDDRVGMIGPEDRIRWLDLSPGWLGGGAVSALHAGGDGAIWVGGGGTVSRIELRAGGGVDVDLLSERDGVPPGGVRALRLDARDRIWIGTYGGGLAVLGGSGPNGWLTTRDGLFDNAISAFLEDESGRLWILGNRGVAVVEPARLDSVLAGTRSRLDEVVFGPDDGIPEGNGGSPATFLDPEGRAWFATIDGLAGIDTRSFPEDRVPLPVRITEIVPEDRDVDRGDPWVIHGAQGDVTFRFVAPGLPAAGNTRFRYRLVGYDRHWIDAGSERLARYTSVDAGRYRFEVLARNRDGVWGTEPATLALRVEPYWWQRTWLRWLLAATAFGLGVLLLVRRLRAAERRNLRLLSAIRERDAAEERARRHQRELEHVARVATAGELATSIAHELNQPLMAIVSNAAASDQLLSNPDMGKEVVREALRDIVSESRRAADVIRSLRNFLQKRTSEHVPLRIESVIGDVLRMLQGELAGAGIELRVDLARDLPEVRGDDVQLQQVLVNLIMNAVEAMQEASARGARRLTIEAGEVEGGLEVRVRDSGPGLGGETARRLFDPFYTTKETGMGIGLAISRTLVEAHGGRIAASDLAERGAEFRIFLPAAAPAGDVGTAEPNA